MLGNKPLSEIRKEISKRFKEAGIDEAQLREQLRQLKPVKRKKRVTVATMLGLPEPKTPKKGRRATSTAR